MTSDAQLMVARRLRGASALVVLLATIALVADHVAARRRAPLEQERVQGLEQSVKTDAKASTALHEERKRQTESSLGREARGRVLGWALLAAAGLFVSSGKWFLTLRPRRLPSLEELRAARFPAVAAGRRPAPRVAPGASERENEPGSELAASSSSFVDELVGRLGRGPEAAIPILQAIQALYRYLPDQVLREVCERTEITPAQLAGSSTFYARFRHAPVGRHVVRVCHGTACHVAGAEAISQELRRHLGIPEGADTDPQRLFTLDAVACVGCCSLAPVMVIEEETAGRLTPATARAALDAVAARG
jgi:NADH:ubiquinone oxidoreductase subunit E